MEDYTLYYRSKTRQEIALEFGFSPRTFNRILKKKKIQIKSGLILPIDQIRIYQVLGNPGTISKR